MHRWFIGSMAVLIAVGCGKRAPKSTEQIAKQLPSTTRVMTLPNGLRVIVHEDHRAPIVAVNVTYHVGSRDDPPGRSGFAHLFEHLMFEGSKHVRRDEFDAILTRVGATDVNAHTNRDVTWYHETVPSHQLDVALFLESDRMGFFLEALDERAFKSARGVVKNELHERIERKPGGMVETAMLRALFPKGHPYRHWTGGSIPDLDAALLADVRDFWMRWYSPNNATLTLVGDVTAEDAFERVRKWFGPIVRGPEVKPWTHGDPPRLEEDTHIALATASERRIVVAWPAPAFGSPGEIELQAAAPFMAGSTQTLMMKDQNLASQVHYIFEEGELCSIVGLDVKLRSGVTQEVALHEIDEALSRSSRFLRRWADQHDAREALYGMYARTIFELDSPTERAQTFALYDARFGRPDAFIDRLRRLETIEEAGVADAYMDWVLRSHRAVVWSQPTVGAPEAGKIVEK